MVEITDEQIRARLLEVEDRIGRHEVALAYLKQELGELQVALRVFERFNERPDFSDMLPPKEVSAVIVEVRKPAGMPTVPQMILEVLAASETPLEPREIVARIRERWWPEAQTTSIGPIAWRMARDGRLF